MSLFSRIMRLFGRNHSVNIAVGQELLVRNGRVLTVYSSSRDSFHPHSIEFSLSDGTVYLLDNARLLRSVIKAWKRGEREFTFDARLIVQNFRKDEYSGAMMGRILSVDTY